MRDATPPLPNFLLIGAAKCGSTSLAAYLEQHPEICFSRPKEPTFFEAQYERGLAYYRRRYFAHWSGEPAVGEGRVWHLYLPYVAPRIRECLPDALLLAVLRDPVERAYSHWWHRYSRGQETLPFAKAVEKDLERIERGERFEGPTGERRWRAGLYRDSFTSRLRVLLDHGFYAEQLERYLELYPSERLKVILAEDLGERLEPTLREVFAFLGVAPEPEVVHDVTPRNPRRERFRGPMARHLNFALRAVGARHLVPPRLRPTVRRWVIPEREAERPPLDPGLARELAEWFDPHNARLERLLGRDLSHWRPAASAARGA